jgi:glutathione S-transferase
MELYYSPFACSLASHIVCREVGIDVTLHRTDFKTKVIEGGGNLQSVSAMGQVPVLVTDDGRVLSENAAVLTYLGDRAADKNLVPDALCFERYELTRFLSLIGTEIHKKGLALVFDPTSPDAVKDFARGAIGRPLDVLEKHLAEREFLLGRAFTVADAYLFWALTSDRWRPPRRVSEARRVSRAHRRATRREASARLRAGRTEACPRRVNRPGRLTLGPSSSK